MTAPLTGSITPQEDTLTAEWVFGDPLKSRESIDLAVRSAVGSTERSNNLPSVVTNIVVDYLEHFQCFGETEWRAFCKTVAPAPALPADFHSLWHGPCPIFPEKKLRETHMLVYIPSSIQGKPITLNRIDELAKRDVLKNEGPYRQYEAFIWKSILREIGDLPIDRSCWALMTKDVLPESGGKSYGDQNKMIADLAKKTLAAYEVPMALEASACFFMNYCSSKQRILSDRPQFYTRCQDVSGQGRLVVGSGNQLGLYVRVDSLFNGVNIRKFGISGLRKFYGDSDLGERK